MAMLTREENERITRVGASTAMGQLLRRYWIPALMSSELPEPDCPPVRVRLLTEPLVAFRDTSGRIGLLEEFCAHRLASLWLGRNEDNGLRCVYHGWKYDVEGACVDQLNEPEQFKQKIRLTAYPTVELGGVIWAYMGPREKMPPPPRFEWATVPATHRLVSKVWQDCNWLQGLEGGLDTSHVACLHRLLTADASAAGVAVSTPFVRSGAATVEVELTDYGYNYVATRPLGDDEVYARGYHFVMPWTQIRPAQIETGRPFKEFIQGHYWVPIDDENCMVWNWMYRYGQEPLADEDRAEEVSDGNGPDIVDAANEFRSRLNKQNNWRLDRQVQKRQSFTGIHGVNVQDRAVQESMGPIVDRSREHLGPADRAIIAARRLLLQAMRTVEEGGDPLGVGPSYYQVRAMEGVYRRAAQWMAELKTQMYPESRAEAVRVR
jgi:phenylpropionate dioxygenase-like ring-hydroxylating dioxygenase large terminal subunit